MPKAKDDGLVQVIREGIRDPVRDTVWSVVTEATEQELLTALREEDIREAILDIIRQELQGALRGIRPKGKGVTPTK